MSTEGRGGFQKGRSGNPGGRPKESGEVRNLARHYSPQAIESLHSIMNEQQRHHSINLASDRSIWGGMNSKEYLERGLCKVEGWLHPFSARFIVGLSAIHRKLGVTGSVGEIGVHHGKLFTLLHADKDHYHKSFAIDVFEDQHLNTDQSGKGDYAKFVQNVERWVGPIDGVEIIKGSSLDIKPQNLRQRVGEVRLFSIDGGHTEECTVNDICLAENVLAANGIVILDDVFNQSWPDVLTGFAKYILQKHDSKLRPFAITPNKVYLAHKEKTEVFRHEMSALFATSWDKDCSLFGSKVAIFGIYDLAQPFKHKVKRELERVHLFKPLSAIREQLFAR